MPKFTKGADAPEHFYPDVEIGDEVEIDFATAYPDRDAGDVETALTAAGWVEPATKAAATTSKGKGA